MAFGDQNTFCNQCGYRAFGDPFKQSLKVSKSTLIIFDLYLALEAFVESLVCGGGVGGASVVSSFSEACRLR